VKKLLCVTLLVFFSAGFVLCADLGFLVDQKFEIEGDYLSYNPVLTPWFSWNGDKGSIFLSASLSVKYNEFSIYETGESGWHKPLLIPELSLFYLSYRFNNGLSIQAGRMGYSDILGFTASGLFDGIRIQGESQTAGSIALSAFYTGFLYKKTANILMTIDDQYNYVKPWDYYNFNDYFASRRLLAAITWIMEPTKRQSTPVINTMSISMEILLQFDLNGNSQTVNSQYLGLQVEFNPANMMRITAGALFELMLDSDNENSVAAGALAKFKTDLPTPLNDWFTFTIKYTSPSSGNVSAAFTPVTSVTQGKVFPGTLAGLARFGAEYTVRINNTILVETVLNYFMRTFDDPSAKTGGNMYGLEFWASAAWQPFNDVRVIIGVGSFLPETGNVYPSGTGIMWKITAGFTLSL
jgi:hypothetical protein